MLSWNLFLQTFSIETITENCVFEYALWCMEELQFSKATLMRSLHQIQTTLSSSDTSCFSLFSIKILRSSIPSMAAVEPHPPLFDLWCHLSQESQVGNKKKKDARNQISLRSPPLRPFVPRLAFSGAIRGPLGFAGKSCSRSYPDRCFFSYRKASNGRGTVDLRGPQTWRSHVVQPLGPIVCARRGTLVTSFVQPLWSIKKRKKEIEIFDITT